MHCGCMEIAPAAATPAGEERKQTLLDGVPSFLPRRTRGQNTDCGGLLGWSELRHDRKHWICGRPGGRKVHAGRPVTHDLTGNSQQERIGDHEPSDVTEIILGGLVRELSHQILLGWDFMRYHGCTPDLTVSCLRMRQGNIPFWKSHSVALLRAEFPQPELLAHQPVQESMEKMLPTGAVGTPPGVNAAARSRRAIKQSLASPIVLVKMKDGSCQFCVDYGQLYNLTRKDAHPVLKIDDTLDALVGAQWFSTLDLASSYLQVEVEEQDQEKTAFTTPFVLYQFKVMPFGLCYAPVTFQRLMEIALRVLVGSDCLVYLDDVIVFGKTAEEHTARLHEVLRRLWEVGLKVKPEKCRLMKRKKKGSPRTQAKLPPCGSGRHRLALRSCSSS
ncbi:reverse transcriptase family protein [Trichinella spiralis]|uniref:reverse transcriptase family protein n=1 Tax=Trichinella spiralis TaxID=6334 RepID=UPI0001EFE778|nr:reverse transcriptase family protein [Trichinella spiralis]